MKMLEAKRHETCMIKGRVRVCVYVCFNNEGRLKQLPAIKVWLIDEATAAVRKITKNDTYRYMWVAGPLLPPVVSLSYQFKEF